MVKINPGPAEPGYALLCKQKRSRSLTSSEANWSGSSLFVIKYVNLYQQSWPINLIGWELEVGVASWQGIICAICLYAVIFLQIVMLSLAYKLDAKSMGFFTLAEWLKGMTELQ